jgi:hypothetical protein
LNPVLGKKVFNKEISDSGGTIMKLTKVCWFINIGLQVQFNLKHLETYRIVKKSLKVRAFSKILIKTTGTFLAWGELLKRFDTSTSIYLNTQFFALE